VQVVALAIGLMAMLLLTVTRAELLDAWQKSLPADAPNRFAINIQPDQRAAVEQALNAAGIAANCSRWSAPGWSPSAARRSAPPAIRRTNGRSA
jgi:predicted lysophospholipase L1 biosynthesis ABC-type transport system permease subunit